MLLIIQIWSSPTPPPCTSSIGAVLECCGLEQNMPQWTLKKSIVNYMHKTVSEFLVCGVGARVVPLRARVRSGWPPLGSFGIFGTSHNNLHQDCVTKQLRFQWFCCIGCKRPRRVHAMVLTFECKVRRCYTDLLNCASNTFQLISLFENRRHAKTKLEHSDALLHIWKRPLLASVSWLVNPHPDGRFASR